jgi:hypothetical protein
MGAPEAEVRPSEQKRKQGQRVIFEMVGEVGLEPTKA